MQNFTNLAEQIGLILEDRGLVLATAESCTGGQVAQVITSVSGSATWFERGFITYSNVAKQEMLGVRTGTLKRFGAVSIETAKEMAEGVLAHSHAHVSLAVTGVAGPTGGTKDKPVGTICFAWAGRERETRTDRKLFTGSRSDIRAQAVEYVLKKLLHFIDGKLIEKNTVFID